MVMAVVLCLDVVFAMVAEMEDLKRGYGFSEAIMFIVSTLPRRIYDYLPLGAFMGCLIGMGLLSRNSELVVVRAAGVSLARIVYAAFKPALVLVLFGMALGEYVVPFTEKIAQSQKAVAQGAGSQVSTASGVWHREGDTFIHISAVEPNGILHGLSLQRYDGKRLVNARYAERAIFQQDHWLMEEVKETAFDREVMAIEHKTFEIWNTELSPATLSLLIVKPDNLSLQGLYRYIDYLQEQSLDASVYLLSFWKKLLQPLSTLVLVFVAISFVFGPLRSATMGFRVFCGLIVGLSFKYLQDLLGPSSLVFGFEPILASLVPIAISTLFGIYLMRKVA